LMITLKKDLQKNKKRAAIFYFFNHETVFGKQM
jgi:hypothetical protein